MIETKKKQEGWTATIISPGDFPLGSPQSRAAARLRLQRIGDIGRGSSECICFPEDEQPFFCFLAEEKIAGKLKCPIHGDRFTTPYFHVYVSAWLREKQSVLIRRKCPQYQKAWFASFPPDLWPAEEIDVNGKTMLRLKDGTMFEAN